MIRPAALCDTILSTALTWGHVPFVPSSSGAWLSAPGAPHGLRQTFILFFCFLGLDMAALGLLA